MQNKIGQIGFTARLLDPKKSTWELCIEWVQPNKGLESLLGAAPEYTEVSFWEAKVKHDPRHRVAFTQQNTSIGLEHEVKYAALVSWTGSEDTNPYILSVCSNKDFDRARNNKPAPKAATVKIPSGTFRVHVLGNIVSGTIENIFKELTMTWADDPTEALLKDAAWEEKKGMKYFPLSTPPPLPPVNTMLLDAAKKAA
jgi:hypothetical protein